MTPTKTFYMAPMLGITDSCFRSAFMDAFGGFDFAISPFIRTLQGQRYKPSNLNDLKLHRNCPLTIFPQILTNQADDFIHLANVLFDMGFPTINLNMGCPVPTASGRGRGAGLLPEVDHVDQMLEKVLSVIPNRLSIKTRIGLETEDELLKMAQVFNRYPLQEIIIHPRTAKQKYSGIINHEAFANACEELKHDIVYSGDIFTPEDIDSLQKKYPRIQKWMVGRGILQDPFLMLKILKLDLPPIETQRSFFMHLADLYLQRDLSQHIVLMRLKTLIVYLGVGSSFAKTTVKKLRKAKSIEGLMLHLPV